MNTCRKCYPYTKEHMDIPKSNATRFNIRIQQNYTGAATLEQLTGEWALSLLKSAYASLQRERERIDGLNVFPVPDGDTGINMMLTVGSAVERAEGSDVSQVFKSAAYGALWGARGNSGAILSQFFQGFAQGVEGNSTAGPMTIAKALEQASQAAYSAVQVPKEGTMLTVARKAAESAMAAAKQGADLVGVLRAALLGAEAALEDTPNQLDVLKQAGVVDAGGEGLVVCLRAVMARIEGRQTEGEFQAQVPTGFSSVTDDAHHRYAIDVSEIEFIYCTEFLIKGRSLPEEEIKGRLESLGDSLVTVGSSDLLKLHLHTNHPSRALEVGLEYGELINVSIENMKEQNRDKARATSANDGNHQPFSNGSAVPITKDIEIISVTSGDGFRAILEQQGVTVHVIGGQGHNPSAGELATAINESDAEKVILLPNNANIMLAAEQSRALTNKETAVVPTTNLPQAVAATLQFDPELSFEDNITRMSDIIEEVRVGEVTTAARDANINGEKVAKDQLIALTKDGLVGNGRSVEEVLLAAIKALDPQEGELITLYWGEGIGETEARSHQEKVESMWPLCEVEVYRGGQPLYSYLVAVE